MPTKTTPPQMTARERLLARQRPTLKMTICDDLQVKTDLDIARFELRKAKSAATDDPKNPNLTAAVAAAEQNVQIAQEAFDAAAIILRFEALPRPAFEELKKKHPPTEAQAEEGTALNFETLAPELIAAASSTASLSTTPARSSTPGARVNRSPCSTPPGTYSSPSARTWEKTDRG